MKRKVWIAMLGVFALISVSACTKEVGSKGWCADMKEKPNGEWTANEASAFAKNCLFKMDE
ncbi:MAG: DUF3012 domain-containing protein [Mariprofundaceae bacterium]|nr:DUF3012 domain-containing protein [Mariprofundaceae bacterium]